MKVSRISKGLSNAIWFYARQRNDSRIVCCDKNVKISRESCIRVLWIVARHSLEWAIRKIYQK